MNNKMPRLVFGAPSSGSGKTMLVCAFIDIFKKRGLRVTALKCGPDYIDPMFHRLISGVPSGNLDTFFTDADTVRYLLEKRASKADLTIIEGVMGYYDGLGGQSERASTYDLACVTASPVILIADGKGASVSLAAVIRGIVDYREDSNIRGVILNRVSPSYYDRIKAVIEAETGVSVLGYVPDIKELYVPSRHLGLVSPDELSAFGDNVRKVSDIMEKTVDIDALYAIAKSAQYCSGKKPFIPALNENVRIAVSRDEAFSFCYTENMELIEEMGGEIVYFSPLKDKALPSDIDGIILGGGYPELYADKLSLNTSFIRSLRYAFDDGIPCHAECGGFMYLHESIEGADGIKYPMAGILSGNVFRTEKLRRFGYAELMAKRGGMMGAVGESIKAHEFHYWDCDENGADFTAKKPLSSREYDCMLHTENLLAGFPHIYYYSNINMLFGFMRACLHYKTKRLSGRHWDGLAKPIDSLGVFEKSITKICAVQGEHKKCDINKKALVVMCADHGIVEEGVTQTGFEVTANVSESIAEKKACVSCAAQRAGVDIYVIDMGINGKIYDNKCLKKDKITDRKIAFGTKNITKESAMSTEQCRKAIQTGIDIVRELKDKGYKIIATGEMGIGNTSAVSVLGALLLDKSAAEVTGRGAGLSDEGLERKINAVSKAIKRIKGKNINSVTDILAEGGGFEIAGLVGMFLGGAVYDVPVVADGVISGISALIAYRLDSRVKNIAIASHISAEPLGKLILSELGLKAPIHGDMRSGEGIGAVMLMPILDMLSDIYNNMRSFEASGIEPYKRY